jgi:hypothetical protein
MLAALLLASAGISDLNAQQAPADIMGQDQTQDSEGMMGGGMGGMMGGNQGGGAMMGRGMCGMMGGRGMGGGHMMSHMQMRGPMMRMMFVMMDADGDGALSLEEVQAVHARIFKAIDADKNGKVTLEEIQQFFRRQ